MSRLDQAFIRAYRKQDAAHSSPPAPNWLAVAASSPIAESFAPAVMETPCRIDPGHTELLPHYERHLPHMAAKVQQPLVGQGSAGAAATFASGETSAATLSPPDPASVPTPESLFERFDHVPSDHAPLANRPPDSMPLDNPPPEVDSEVRAAFEVDRFLWPEGCQSLLAAAPDEYRRLANELLSSSRGERKLFLVTSLHRGEGRTSLTLCLAHALAEQHARVAMMDGDLGRAQLARQLKLLPATGWDEALQSAEPVTESWIESVADGTVLVPLRGAVDERDWRVDIGRLEQTMELLCRKHDVVLVDAGPLDDLASRELMSWLAGAVKNAAAIVVRDVRSLTTSVLSEVEQHLSKIGVGRWDVAENFT